MAWRILGEGGSRGRNFSFFLFSQHVPFMFLSTSQWVHNMFPKFPMGSHKVFPIAPRFNPIYVLLKVLPEVTPIYSWAKVIGTSSFNRISYFGGGSIISIFFGEGPIKMTCYQKKNKSWTCEAPAH